MRPEGKECTTSPSQSPTSVLAPIVTPPPPLTLPAAVVKPRLPSAAVWGSRAPAAPTAAATAPTNSERWADVQAASASDSRAAAALSSAFHTPTPAARGSLARCRKHGPHARAAMQSQETMPSVTAAVEKWIDEVKLQARLCKTSPLVFSVSIPEQRSFGGRAFPLTLVPAAAPHTPAMLKARWHLAEWAAANRDALLELVEEYDAVLLRGFPGAVTAEDFSAFVQALRLEPFEMGCSAAPRTELALGVFTANEAPPQEPIPLHHEMAQCDLRPDYVAFHCVTPAAAGGATPIIPSHAVAAQLRRTHPAVAARLAAEGVRYVRVLPEEYDPSSPIGKSWKASFAARTREEAEVAMAAQGLEWSWLSDGSVRTVTKPLSALATHQGTGKEIFFNAIIAASQGWVDSRNDPAHAVRYGGGEELDEEARAALAALGDYCAAQQVAFAWRAGDVLLIDNNKAMHSRQTFTPPRRVLASLWGAKLG